MSWTDPYYTEQLLSIREASGGNPAGIVRELVEAYNERCEACGMDTDAGSSTDLTIAVPSEGDTALHYQGLFRDLHEGMESLVASNRWWDHEQTPATQSNLTVMGNATWRTRAGLPSGAGNFRRVTGFTDNDFSQPIFGTPGAIAEDDYFGPWIIADTQAGLDALRWTTANQISLVERIKKQGSDNTGSTADERIANACANWGSPLTPVDDAVFAAWPSMPELTEVIWDAFSGSTLASCSSVSFVASIHSPDNSLSRDAELWARGVPFQIDFNGVFLGINEWTLTNLASGVSVGDVFTSSRLGDDSTCPFTLAGVTGTGSELLDQLVLGAIIKWDFTNRSYTF